MARTTISQLRQMVEELLSLAPLAERYRELEKAVKAGLVEVKYKDLDIPGKGRVFISQSERVTISPELAIEVLGEEMARRVTVIKKSVPNSVIKAFVEAGEISEEERRRLLEQADKSPIINLYVRPLS